MWHFINNKHLYLDINNSVFLLLVEYINVVIESDIWWNERINLLDLMLCMMANATSWLDTDED